MEAYEDKAPVFPSPGRCVGCYSIQRMFSEKFPKTVCVQLPAEMPDQWSSGIQPRNMQEVALKQHVPAKRLTPRYAHRGTSGAQSTFRFRNLSGDTRASHTTRLLSLSLSTPQATVCRLEFDYLQHLTEQTTEDVPTSWQQCLQPTARPDIRENGGCRRLCTPC